MTQFSKFLCFIVLTAVFFTANGQTINPIAVEKQMEKVAIWQMEHFRDTYSDKKEPHHIADWTNGALYVGMVKYAAIAKTDKYWKWLERIAKEQKSQLHWRKYHADDHTIGQMYIELFRKNGDSTLLKPTIERFNYIMKNPSKEPITLDNYKHMERWTWCDALFMSPPIWAKLSNVTGDKKYSDWMLKEFEASKQHLFDEEEHLFYRDNSFIGQLDHGKKTFWSRGNGWVFGGLTLLMDEYKPGSKEYEYFKVIYLKMAEKLIKIQTPQGHWTMSLLNQELYPTPETSGTSFFTFGLAWGVNKGVLDAKIYQPHIEKAWNCLVGHINKDGMLGYVQPIGAGPDKAFENQTEVYGTGAFLAAGSEVYKLVGGQTIFQLSNPDYKKSPKTGMTRQHWFDAAKYMLEGAFSYVKSNDDALKFPKIGNVAYPNYSSQVAVEKLEGLCRTLFVATPLLKQNSNLVINNMKIGDYYRQNILNLIDEKHPSFIKDKVGDWPGQTLVEFGALSMSMFIIPEVLWDPLPQDKKDILARKMISYADGPTVDSNWKFFNIFVLSFFKDQGYAVNEKLLVEYLEKSLQHYKGEGWYNDNPAYDYYSMWAFQMYGPVWTSLFGNKYYPEIAQKFTNNFLPIEKNYPYMFSEDGKMIMWGRSITYRFASVSPLPLLSFYENQLTDANWGGLRRTASGVMLQFLQHPEFMKDRIPTLGFYGLFDPSTQPYSCRGSVFWMGKSFLSLSTPEDSKFWNEIENNGVWENELKNTTVSNHFYEGSNIMVTNYKGIGASEIRAWNNVAQKGIKESFRASENYNKLSYNSAFPWQADTTQGTAAMSYIFKTNTKDFTFESGHLYDFKKFENEIYYRDLKSEYLENVSIKLADIPVENGIIRVDKINSDKEFSLKLGHYSLPHSNGYIKKSTKIINGKEVQIIDNGDYQLALIPVLGWDSIETITSNNVHPETKESTVINVSKTFKPLAKNQVLITLMLWKKSGESFSENELNLVQKVKAKKGNISLTFLSGNKKEVIY